MQFVARRLRIDPARREPARVEQRLVVAFAAVAQQADDAAALAAFAHARGQLQAGGEVGARGAAVAGAEQLLQQPRRRDRGLVVDLDDVVDHLEQEAGLHAGSADALDQRREARPRIAVARRPADRERATARLRDAQTRVQPAVAQVASDRRRRAAGACAANDPRRPGMGLARQLDEDRLGDVVVAAPVGRAFGQTELVEMAGPARGMFGRARLRVGGILDQIAVPAERAHVADLARRGAHGHHRGEAQAEQAREPGLRDRGAARGRVDHRLAFAQPAVAQRVQDQRAREPVLETARRMRGLVLEIEVDAGEARKHEVQQVGVGRARGLALERADRLAQPRAFA